MKNILNKVMITLKYILSCTLDLLYSDGDKCCICGDYCGSVTGLCNSCYSKIRICNERYYIKDDEKNIECYSAAYYSNVIKEMIINLKYKNDFNSGNVLAEIMQQAVIRNKIEFDYVTFVPMTKKYIKIRGYNQSKFLAKHISQQNKVKTLELIKKIKNSKDQIGLGPEERWDNIKGCFKFIGNKNNIKGKTILLVDDVMTTGATAFYCAKQLIDNDVDKVIVLTAAKSKI